MTAATIPFIDLAAQRRALGAGLEAAIMAVVDHGGYIMGPEVKALETALSAFCDAPQTISCANGTDAIGMVLMARGVKPGDAIICPSFTFAATAEVVAWLGATPVFADVDPGTFNISIQSAQAALHTARKAGLRPVGMIAVDLFGLPADYAAIEPFCAANNLFLICDAAQSFGAQAGERKVGSIGLATTTSFFPAKPLGCYGDGGAIFTGDPELADVMRSIRVHGQGSHKYENVRIGLNARLDTIQAAILLEKLKLYPQEIQNREAASRYYDEGLKGLVETPQRPEGHRSVWAQYTVKVPAARRAAIQKTMAEHGVPTMVYYPMPLHRQKAYKHYPVAGNGLPVSEQLAEEVMSLPMHGYLDRTTQDRVVDALRKAVA